jgi:hypothetical protein
MNTHHVRRLPVTGANRQLIGQKWTFGPGPRLRSRAGLGAELNQQVEAA